MADEVFEVTGKNPLLEIALELERIALQDEYFVKRKLYPNVDFYSGLIYEAMGFPVEMFPVLFAIRRTVGWVLPVGGDGHGPGAEDRPAAAGVHRLKRREYVTMDKRARRSDRQRVEAAREAPRGRGTSGRGPRPFCFSRLSPTGASAAWPPSRRTAPRSREAYFSSTTLRRTLSVGVSSPPSTVKSGAARRSA